MAALFRQYLCCCLPHSRVDEDPERAPLLNPDILPEAPPRPQGRSTEEQQRERESLQRILEHATERLINVQSLAAFLPSRATAEPPAPSRSPTPSPSRRRKRPASSWRPPMDDTPLAPVRVVQLGHNWEELPSSGAPVSGRPASSHSMRTLPRGGGARKASGLRLGVEAAEDGDEGDDDATDGDGETDSRFGTYASYRTAKSSGGTVRARDVRALWGAQGSEGEVSEELSHAIAALESSIDDWSLPGGLGPYVADLGGDGEEVRGAGDAKGNGAGDREGR
ncbi:hypothetical protein JCM10450v2_006608 [Rhodotorula kratochvilovae]